MTQCSRRIGFALLALAVLPNFAGAARAGDSLQQTNFGTSTFHASPACPVSEFPTFETLAPVPSIFDSDPFPEDLTVFCLVQADKGEKGRKKAKGTWESELIVRDNISGGVEIFPLGSGRFKTGPDGTDQFDFDLPGELFADGFESGDVSAWSYTRADFTNKKKADFGGLQCGKSVNRSN